MPSGGARPATEKYLTAGSSGVCGLKTVVRYAVVRFAYAGESSRARRSVVKEEGSAARESAGFAGAALAWRGASSGAGVGSDACGVRVPGNSSLCWPSPRYC